MYVDIRFAKDMTTYAALIKDIHNINRIRKFRESKFTRDEVETRIHFQTTKSTMEAELNIMQKRSL